MPVTPSDPPLTIAGVYGDQPFAEIVSPLVVVENAERIGIIGYVTRPQWPGRDVFQRSGSARFGVYDRRTLNCLMVVVHHQTAYVAAFHPSLPLLAIAVGTFDGTYYEGELLLAHVDSGRVVSAFGETRYVGYVEWLDDHALRILTAPYGPDDDEDDATYLATLRRDDWLAVGEAEFGEPDEDVAATEELRASAETDHSDGEIPGPRSRARLADIAAEQGRSWESRGQVWDVEALPDGRTLAAADGTTLECHSPTGELLWTVRSDFGARQIRVAQDGTSAWALICPPQRWDGAYVTHPDTALERRSLDDGSLIESIALDIPRVMTSRADGLLALRDARDHVDGAPLLLVGPDGTQRGGEGMTAHSLFGTYLSPRHCPDLLFVRKAEDETGTWVSRYDDASDTYHDLFPLKVAEDRPWTSGGPAAYAETADGPVLVVSGSESGPHGVPAGGFVVSARNYPSGEVRWVVRADDLVVAVDCVGEVAYVAYSSGEIAAVDVRSGAVLWRQELAVGDHPVLPLSMAAASDGSRLVIGLLDGRILDCSL